MRELNNNEVAEVSGGFFFGNIGEAIGGAIGHAISDTLAEAASLLGKGIGDIFDLDIAGAFNNISQGILGLVNWFSGK